MKDTYYTLKEKSIGIYREKGSKFIALAFPITSIEEAVNLLNEHKKKYYDARHICFAYMLGADNNLYRYNDDGEPTGTAGLPILNQIRSFNLSNILIIVIRYFGGIKLGVGGLVNAYKNATQNAIEQSSIIQKYLTKLIELHFEYKDMNNLMKIIKENNIEVISSDFNLSCKLVIEVQKDKFDIFIEHIEKVKEIKYKIISFFV